LLRCEADEKGRSQRRNLLLTGDQTEKGLGTKSDVQSCHTPHIRGRALHTPEEYQREEYQRMAVKCLRLARVVRDPKEKLILVEMARTWRRLAERLRAKAEKEMA